MKQNKSELCRSLQVSMPILKKHLGRDGAPKKDMQGRFDVDAVRAFIEAARKQDNNTPDSDKRDVQIEKLKLECAILRQKLNVRGDVIHLSELTPFLAAFLEETRFAYVTLSNALPPALEGKTALEMLPVLQGFHFRRCCDLARFLARHSITVQVSDGVKRVEWPVKSLVPGMASTDATPATPIEDQLDAATVAIREGFLALGATVADECVGKTEDEISAIITAAVKSRLHGISEQLNNSVAGTSGKKGR